MSAGQAGQTAAGHPGELTLRRLGAGEALPDSVRQHATGCEACQGQLKRFSDEQRSFEQQISLERFSAGVERAARTPRTVAAPRRRLGPALLALAAVLVAVVAFRLVAVETPGNRLKGGAGLEVTVGGAAGAAQRKASTDPLVPEALAAGERVRLGLMAGEHAFAVVISVDEAGVVTPIYSAGASSLELKRGPGTTWLPDSLEFTGAGVERVVVVYSDEALEVSRVVTAGQRAFKAGGGDLLTMPNLQVPGDQVHRTFQKP